MVMQSHQIINYNLIVPNRTLPPPLPLYLPIALVPLHPPRELEFVLLPPPSSLLVDR